MTEEHKAQRRPCRPCRVGFWTWCTLNTSCMPSLKSQQSRSDEHCEIISILKLMMGEDWSEVPGVVIWMRSLIAKLHGMDAICHIKIHSARLRLTCNVPNSPLPTCLRNFKTSWWRSSSTALFNKVTDAMYLVPQAFVSAITTKVISETFICIE